jgi:heme exporter protein CcmD
MNGIFEMGGYGFYVWSAYGATAVVIAAEILAVRARRKAALLQARIVAGDIPRPTASTVTVR